MAEITDDMCRRAIAAMVPDRIQGFSTPSDDRRVWGAPYWVMDYDQEAPRPRELWRGDSADEMAERCEIERMRLGLRAALGGG